MQRKTRGAVAIAALLALASLASAEGAGGVVFGIAKPGWNPSFMPEARMPVDLEYFGGFGYGVSEEGNIVGGFGIAFMDAAGDRTAGGAGGMVVGHRLVQEAFVHLDLSARLGLGGMGEDVGGGWEGHAIVYAEPLAELGIALTPWMRLSATLGYQFIGNFAPGKLFSEVLLRSPTVGLTVSWGDYFRR
jgi:hypothetical protein